jgi:SOS response regulatory protein OraA/RecX
VDKPEAHTEGLKMLAGRELSVEGVRARLQDRGYPPDEIASAIERLLESGALDDARVARAFARTAATVKHRGRLRVMRELLQMGIESAIASEALGEVYGEIDERALIDDALRRKLRGRTRLSDQQEYARTYQFLMRQGFSPGGVAAALRRFRSGQPIDQD